MSKTKKWILVLLIPFYLIIVALVFIPILVIVSKLPLFANIVLFLVILFLSYKLWKFNKKEVLLATIVIPTGVYILILSVLLIGGSILDPCSVRYSEEIYSPEGTYSAQVTETNCGATVRYIADVHIKDKSTDDRENVFAGYADLNGVELKWLDDAALQIEHEDCDNRQDVFGIDKRWKDVEIVEKCK